jgi:ComF family protein
MSVFELAIGWLAPADCVGCGEEGTALCGLCAQTEIVPFGERCFKCNTLSPDAKTCSKCRVGGAPRYVWLTTDYQGAPKALVRLLKFHHQRTAASNLALLMSETLYHYLGDDLPIADYVVVAVPTATSRVRQRSFDHTALLADRIARRSGLSRSGALKRLGQSRQVGSKRSERLRQAEGTYYISRPAEVAGRNILLVDDVVTTGATLGAATKALKAAGAKHIDALVFAKKL